jgi:hypothetical protein
MLKALLDSENDVFGFGVDELLCLFIESVVPVGGFELL